MTEIKRSVVARLQRKAREKSEIPHPNTQTIKKTARYVLFKEKHTA